MGQPGPTGPNDREQLVMHLGRTLYRFLPPVWQRVHAEYRVAGRHIEFEVHVFAPDGSMLTLPPLLFLIFSGALLPEADSFRTAYAGGVMMLAALLAGGCAPAMILGWNRPDPEPEG